MGLVYNATEGKWEYLIGLDEGGSGGGGSAKQVTLLSVTTAPSGTFAKGSQYYNSTDKKIYTAVTADTWTGATQSDAEFGVIYVYDNDGTTEYYQWDGDNLVETDLEKYQLKSNITDSFSSSSQITYPSSKALNDGLSAIKPSLFDIKTMSEQIATKGWCCISDSTQKKLDKADVPTAYNFLKNKLDTAEATFGSWTQISYYRSKFCPIIVGDYILFTNESLYKCLKSEIDDQTKWVKIADGAGDLNSFAIQLCNFFGDKIYIGAGGCIYVIDKTTLTVIKQVWCDGLTDGFSLVDNYIYYTAYNSEWKTYRIPYTSVADDIVSELVANDRILNVFRKQNGYYFFELWNGGPNHAEVWKATDLSDNTTYIKLFNDWDSAGLINLNNGDFLKYSVSSTEFSLIICDDLENWYTNSGGYNDYNSFKPYATIPFNDIGITGTYQNFFQMFKNNSGWSFVFKFSGVVYGIYTTDFQSFITMQLDNNYYQNYTVQFDTDGQYAVYQIQPSYAAYMANATPTVYTDTVNGIDIKYYKNGDWKICTPDIAVGNDTNLQTVYEFLGYINYWWIDTTNEQISLQRNSNLWSMMYVGDDYEDYVLPSGNYRKNKLVNELIEDDSASITIDVKGNQFYKFTNNAITDITIDSCEDSIEETVIKFTTGSSAPTLTDNANLEWYDGIPTLLANTSYTIVIVDKTAYYQEN